MTDEKRKPKIILVDDDPDFQTVVRDWLTPNYNLIWLCDGNGLAEQISAYEPDLIILDVLMPGSNGFSLCRRLRADGRFAHLPVLFLTGCRDDDGFIKNLEVGGTAFLTKPVARRRLLSMLQELTSDRKEPAAPSTRY